MEWPLPLAYPGSLLQGMCQIKSTDKPLPLRGLVAWLRWMLKSLYQSNYWPETQNTIPATKTAISIKATLESDLLSSFASFDSKYSSYLSDIFILHVLKLPFPVGHLSK